MDNKTIDKNNFSFVRGPILVILAIVILVSIGSCMARNNGNDNKSGCKNCGDDVYRRGLCHYCYDYFYGD